MSKAIYHQAYSRESSPTYRNGLWWNRWRKILYK